MLVPDDRPERHGPDDNITSTTTSSSPSVTTPTGVPTFTVDQGPAGSDTAVLTWGYQGNDDSGFEIEEEDTSIGENFHTILTPGAVDGNATETTSVGLTGGDSYNFRIRADHSDGSVSDYVGSGLTVPIANAPSVSVTNVTIGDDEYLRVGWSGALGGVDIEVQCDALPGSTQWYSLGYNDDYVYPPDLNHSSGDSDEGYALDPGTFTSSDTYDGVFPSGEYPSGSYTYRIRSVDQYGNPTKWSSPASGSLTSTAPLPGATDLQLSSTDNSITATWPVADGPTYLFMQQQGLDSFLDNELGLWSVKTSIPQLSQDGTTYTSTMGNLPSGTTYDFVLWTQGYSYPGTDNGVAATAFTKDSITTGGTPEGTPPAGPGNALATWNVPNEAGVFLHWSDYSNNESDFWIYRSTGSSFNASSAVLVGTVGADTSTFDDANADPTQVNNYEIFAVNDADMPTPPATMPTSQPATTQAAGGPWYVTPRAFSRKARGVVVAVEFDLYIDGPGPAPAVYQTVAASGNPVTNQEITSEKQDHGGADEFAGPIPDNAQGNPNIVTPGLEQTQAASFFSQHKNTATHWFFEDAPSFPVPPYAPNFVGTKSFVTTVKDPAGNIIKVIRWHVSQAAVPAGKPPSSGLSITIDG